MPVKDFGQLLCLRSGDDLHMTFTLLLGGPEKLGTSLREPRAEREENLALSEPPALLLSCFCCFDQSGRRSLRVPEVPRLDHLFPSRLRQLTAPAVITVVITAVITAVVVVERRMLSADDGMRPLLWEWACCLGNALSRFSRRPLGRLTPNRNLFRFGSNT